MLPMSYVIQASREHAIAHADRARESGAGEQHSRQRTALQRRWVENEHSQAH
jgi:hypothetical protein